MQVSNPIRNRPVLVMLALFCVVAGVALEFLNANSFQQENAKDEPKPKENKVVESRTPPCVTVLTRYAGMPATAVSRKTSAREWNAG